jgi:Domain of unknown function (DUF4160)
MGMSLQHTCRRDNKYSGEQCRWNEKDHPVSHFPAYHAGRRASVSMDGEVHAGRLEPRALQFVREWAKLRQGEILANWERARRNEPLRGIEPLS